MAIPSAASTRPAAVRSQALDDLIMGTNSSSIVSKRSVERLYYPDEPPFFRYFVKKFQRRAPLINRGYWLRLRAIDTVVRRFITQETCKKKVVINLGCGSDVLPWQCHARYGAASDDALFVDADYPDLVRKKRTIVLETPQLRHLLGTNFVLGENEEDHLLLRSDKYCQVGCDLRQLDAFRATLESFLSLSDCVVLFVAEVSVTYMDTQSADALIQWASSIGQAEFCLLEQILPHGPDHPFAQTMLRHFDKLSTPPRSVGQYQTLEQQAARFQTRGWRHVDIWDLWQAWSSDLFVSSPERAALDEVEPFDEWEEFMLFARHYFILHASATQPNALQSGDGERPYDANGEPQLEVEIEVTDRPILKAPKRRFGNAMVITNVMGQRHVLHMMGLDTNGRAATYDVFSLDGKCPPPEIPLNGPLPRVCYTLTDLGDYGILLVGGRTSPACALSDSWLFTRGTDCHWRAMPRLPIPLFRHSAVRLGGSYLVLVIGGKTGSSQISENCFVFHPECGWLKCQISGIRPEPSFGSIICTSSEAMYTEEVFHGVLAGGINKYGRIVTKKYLWRVEMTDDQPNIKFSTLETDPSEKDTLSLFGANVVDMDSYAVICGGTGADASSQGQDIRTIAVSNSGYQVTGTIRPKDSSQCMPFMIRSSAIRDGSSSILVVGGGATCFSMGTFWEPGVYRIHLPHKVPGFASAELARRNPTRSDIQFVGLHTFTTISHNNAEVVCTSAAKASVTTVPRIQLDSTEKFHEILRDGRPVIIEGLNLGQCLQKWTPSYLVEQVGSDQKVVVHECHRDTEKMDFNSKNFSYVTESFGSIMDRVQTGARLYLRALSRDKPSELPARMEEDFPRLAAGFSLPTELDYVKEHLFSSVLRVSGRVNMWLHYDVMANVYAQVVGSKRMIIFPPSDVRHLSFAPGASSSSLDVFSMLDPPSSSLSGTHPQEAILNPGDVLLLPAMWLHTATPMSDMSVAVNVFFRDLESGHYSAGRDVYGNRDLEAYEKGRQAAARISKSFQQLPLETRRFYLSRIADELLQVAEESS